MAYNKETWKNARHEITKNMVSDFMETLNLNSENREIAEKVISKGIIRQFDETFSTEEKKEEFLKGEHNVSVHTLFEKTRVSDKVQLAKQVSDLGILPIEVAETLTGKQLKALLDSYNSNKG